MEKIGKGQYHLDWNEQQHVVKEVRIVDYDEEADEFQYKVIDFNMPYESHNFVFWPGQRLEERFYLFSDKQNYKSVFQTMVEICLASYENGQKIFHVDDLYKQVYMLRMVARGTIGAELSRRPCFISSGGGWWEFDPSKVFDRVKIVPHWSVVSFDWHRSGGPQPRSGSDTRQTYTGDGQPTYFSPDQQLSRIIKFFKSLKYESLNRELRAFQASYRLFQNFIDDLYTSQTTNTSSDGKGKSRAERLLLLLQTLETNPSNFNTASEFQRILNQVLEELVTRSPQARAELDAPLSKATKLVWKNYIEPGFTQIVQRLLAVHKYEQVELLIDVSAYYGMPHPAITKEQINKYRKAYEWYELSLDAPVSEALTMIIEALEVAPDFEPAQQRKGILVARQFEALTEVIAVKIAEKNSLQVWSAIARTRQFGEGQVGFDYDIKLQHIIGEAVERANSRAAELLDNDDDAGASELYCLAARLYQTLTREELHTNLLEQYLDALYGYHELLIKKNSKSREAALLLAQIFEFAERPEVIMEHSYILKKTGLALAYIYEQLGLWSMAYIMRYRLVTLLAAGSLEARTNNNLLMIAKSQKVNPEVVVEKQKFIQFVERQGRTDFALIFDPGFLTRLRNRVR